MSPRLRWVAGVAVFTACSVPHLSPSTSRVEPPATPLANASTPRAADLGEVESLSIEQFAPLLTLPELSAAARAFDAGQPKAAADEVERVFQSRKLPPRAAAAWQLLLGRLRERAGELPAASAAYESAAGVAWPLAGYARLGAGRSLLAAGQHRLATQHLQQVPPDQPIAAEAKLLLAEAAVLQGDHERAIDIWRQVLGEKERAASWPDVALQLSRTLLQSAGVGDPEDKSAAQQAKITPGAVAQRDRIVEALRLARRVGLERADRDELRRRAEAVEQRALASLPPSERSGLLRLSASEQLVKLGVLVGSRQAAEAEAAAQELLAELPSADQWGSVGCEAAVLRAKAIALGRKWGRAADALDDPIRHCKGEDVRARALYLAGKYAASDGRHSLAIQRYAQLEQEAPTHRLADDARINAALSYSELGAEARFTELLSSLPDLYPQGDLMLDGVFRLAVRRMEKGDWSGAAAVLDRAAVLVENDAARGHEFSGRERYFRARAWMETGERERGHAELEAVIAQLPLSYYMLHAYSRLVDADPERARRAKETALARAAQEPFRFAHRPEFELPSFQRGLELLRVGDVELARTELESITMPARNPAPEMLWAVALLYDRAGAAQVAHGIARGLLTDWLSRWPAGDWVTAWKIAFPRPHHPLVAREARKNGIPESLAYAVMREESAFDASAVSPADAYGLMQLILPTARSFAKPLGLPATPESLKRPPVNIALGCSVLGKLTRTFAENPLLAIPGYNAGPGRPRRWLRDRPHLDFDVWVETIPFNETRRYTKRVLASRAAYAFLYEQELADETMALPLRFSQKAPD